MRLLIALVGIFLSLVGVAAVGPFSRVTTHQVKGGSYYQVVVSGKISGLDLTNEFAVGICYVKFLKDGRPVRVAGSLVSGVSPSGPFCGYEYMFVDQSNPLPNCQREWRFQWRVPDEADEISLEVKRWRSLGPVDFNPARVIENENWDEEISPVGLRVSRTHTSWQNEIVLSAKTLDIDRRSCFLQKVEVDVESGGSSYTTNIVWTKSLREALPIPSDKVGRVTVEIRGPKNASPMHLKELKVVPRFRPTSIPSKYKPIWYDLSVAGYSEVEVSGSLVGYGLTNRLDKAIVARVQFKDSAGKLVLAPGLANSLAVGNYCYLSAASGDGCRFKRKLLVPREARTLSVGFEKWAMKASGRLMDFDIVRKARKFELPKATAEWANDSVGSRKCVRILLSEWLATNDIAAVVRSAGAKMLKASVLKGFLLRPDVISRAGKFRLKGYPDLPVSHDIDWGRDPFSSATWRLKYSSAIWVPFAAPESDFDAYYDYCRDAWRTFWKSNSLWNPTDSMVYNEHTMAGRVEAILLLLFGMEDDISCGRTLRRSVDRISKDEDFLEGLLYQS